MSELQSHHEIPVSSERSFGIVFAAFFGIVGLWPLLGDGTPRLWPLIVAGAFLVAGLLFPRVLRPLNLLWFKFGLLLGRVVTPIVMFLVFAVAVLPTALLMRALGKDPMKRKLDGESPSYWIRREAASPDANSMKNQF